MVWQLGVIAVQLLSRYIPRVVPQILLPITITVGFIGYTIEGYVRSRSPPALEASKSISELREERRLQELEHSLPSTNSRGT